MGQLAVLDIYIGRNMGGLSKGQIKKLLIIENLPVPVHYAGSMDPITHGGNYYFNRVLGTVPVEEDGSVNMRVPALRSLQFIALDENNLSVKRMLSFLTVQPGEFTTCIGCHEDRTMAVPIIPVTMALQRPPSEITPVPGVPEVFDFPRDIQPILDQHCISCHNPDYEAGSVVLTGDNAPMFTHSYYELSMRYMISDGRDLARGNYPPYTIGSSVSPLIDMCQPSHYGVAMPENQFLLIKTWIDASANFPGTYAALGGGVVGSYAEHPDLYYHTLTPPDFESWSSVQDLRSVSAGRCTGCHPLASDPWDIQGFQMHNHFRLDPPPWLAPENFQGRTGTNAWVDTYLDRTLRFARDNVFNLSRPEKSEYLMAPLSTAAGGLGVCGNGGIFQSTDDPDYQKALNAISSHKDYLDSLTRFNMANFKPRPEYVREMKRFGILPDNFNAETDPIDVYDVDRRYWESLWWKSLDDPTGITGIRYRR
jgi:hypothetical protein